MKTTEHTTQKKRSGLTLMVLVILLAISISLLAVSQRADASIFYTVNSAGDEADAKPGDGTCETVPNDPTPVCTLRAAIQESNANPASPEVIKFGIPGTGVHTIQPKTVLPPLTDAVTITGYTQDGASVNTLAKGTNAKLMIQLDGSQISGDASGLHINAPDVVVRGLVINGFLNNIHVDNAAASAKIQGNFIGTYPSGTEAPTGSSNGVLINDASGKTNNTVGGAAPDDRNLISGNSAYGVAISFSNDNGVYRNLIGTQRDGKSPLGNSYSGVGVAYGNNNEIGSSGYANTIAFNDQAGVNILGTATPGPGVANGIFSNSIFSNGLLGINLNGGTQSTSGATANDKGDADAGPNNLQNKPVLTSAKKTATGKTLVKGTLNSKPNGTYYVQFFSNPKGTNEGKKLLGSKFVSTDGSGDASFRFATKKKVVLGQNVTTTAADSATGDTSEFSAPRKVVAS